MEPIKSTEYTVGTNCKFTPLGPGVTCSNYYIAFYKFFCLQVYPLLY